MNDVYIYGSPNGGLYNFVKFNEDIQPIPINTFNNQISAVIKNSNSLGVLQIYRPTSLLNPFTNFMPGSSYLILASNTFLINQNLTPTPTPTISLTPTNTSTPTISLTPTNTSTPTISLTPTNTPTISLTPTLSQINNLELLFDKSSFVDVVSSPYLERLNLAVDRWSNFIKFNSDIYSAIKNYYSSTLSRDWNGIYIKEFNLINDNTSNTIASCGPSEYFDIEPGPTGLGFNTGAFNLTINTRFESNYTNNNWIDILTHELGHALGIGIYWNPVFASSGAVPPTDNFLDGISYTKTQTGYNAVVNNVTFNKIPLEESGGDGTQSSHWEDNFRSGSSPGANGVSYPGVITELMTGFFDPVAALVISDLSLGSLRDFGYEEINPGNNEGMPIVDYGSSGLVGSSLQISETSVKKWDCCCSLDDCKKMARIEQDECGIYKCCNI